MHWRSQEPCAYGPHSCLAFILGLGDLSRDVTTSVFETQTFMHSQDILGTEGEL